MSADERYAMNMNVAFGSLKLIDVNAVRRSVKDDWFNQTL